MLQRAAGEKEWIVRRTRLAVPTMPTFTSEKGARMCGRNAEGQKTWSSQKIVIGVVT